MTNWRAVVAGVLLAATVEAAVLALTGRVTVVGGLAGSAFAGYLADDEVPEGMLHGLLAALAWGSVFLPAVVFLTVRSGWVLVPFGLLLAPFDTRGEMAATLLLGVTFPNVVAGGVGSVLRWWATPPPDVLAE